MKQLYDNEETSGKYGKPVRPVKYKIGRTTTKIQEQRSRCVEQFEELLNRPSPLNPPDIKAAPTDITAIRTVKSGKATVPENIPVEVRLRSNCKHASRSIQEGLEGRTSADRLEGRKPHQKSKKEGLCKSGNYRGIILLY
ncbi:unnamed protein product [Schistosoma mattheei]|uniref:Uncharacterized protein n=1 Tax=Schistosoma mattheei TaxID=31246 RepID=A0AA85BYG6_9TREM|nr:unnamed protein product [Schistosoma mattheei]